MSFIPPGLLPNGSNDVLTSVVSKWCRLQGPGTGALSDHLKCSINSTSFVGSIFQDNPTAACSHDLLCVVETSSSVWWFMTAAVEALNVWDYIRVKDGSHRVDLHELSLSELSGFPCTIYVHQQQRGDLVVVPPRWYVESAPYPIAIEARPVSRKSFTQGLDQRRAFCGSG